MLIFGTEKINHNMAEISSDYSIYIHIPFCRHRCAYCDFNTYAGQESLIDEYVLAACHEIDLVGASHQDIPVKSIFFGGGTPSLVNVDQYKNLFNSISRNFNKLSDCEISLEANPGTVSLDYLLELKSIGFNRISYGVQSSNPEELRMLERIHTYSDVINAYRRSRKAGFENLNFDLIYGLPEQSLNSWKKSLQLISELGPEHISAYALTLEHGTPFGKWASRGFIPIPDPDTAADQYEWTMDYLAEKGFGQYEISNWSKKGYECQHNLQYWHNHNYFGIGAGAHGYINGCRYSNVLRIKTYIDRLKNAIPEEVDYPTTPASVSRLVNSVHTDMQETLMTGLRLTDEGVSCESFFKRFNVELHEIFGNEINYLEKKLLIEVRNNPGRIRLTRKGRLLGNQVFMQFVD